ncbi:MAG: histidine triad (HIT) family protein [Sphingobacteriales bacterium]|jgi:histidine triad (HIT) family protein
MASLFTKIVQGEIPCHKIAEDQDHLAFLDIQPLVRGHVLVIPKKEVDYIFDMESKDLAALMRFAQKVAKGMKLALPCKKIGVSVVGLEVLHTHIHLIPMNAVADMDFSKPKLKLEHSELEEIARKISGEI